MSRYSSQLLKDSHFKYLSLTLHCNIPIAISKTTPYYIGDNVYRNRPESCFQGFYYSV